MVKSPLFKFQHLFKIPKIDDVGHHKRYTHSYKYTNTIRSVEYRITAVGDGDRSKTDMRKNLMIEMILNDANLLGNWILDIFAKKQHGNNFL